MKSTVFVYGLLFALLSLGSEAFAAPTSLALNATITATSKKLTVTITPSESAAGCTYVVHGSAKKNPLLLTPLGGTQVASIPGSDSLSTLVATKLKVIRRKSGGPLKRKMFLVAEATCTDGTVRSTPVQIKVNTDTKKGHKKPIGWLNRLANRFVASNLSLAEAFPNLSFTTPIDIQNAGDGSNRLFVVEQGGIIYVISNSEATAVKDVFLDLSAIVTPGGGEQGLLGLAFHPNYENNGFLFVNYTDLNGDTVIARYTRSAGNPNQADPASGLIFLSFTQPFSNHNGGWVGFGPDGFLYIASGDGGSGGDPQGNGQSKTTLLGKILRINVDTPAGMLNYSIPPSNPFAGNTSGFKEEIYALGMRNPWRMSFDPTTNRLWAGDVGQGTIEEIDLIENGANYGWNTMEGSSCFNAVTCDQTGLTLPIHEYSHSVGTSITGGYVYRGTLNPGLSGLYLYADFIEGLLFALKYNNGVATNYQLFDTSLFISSFGTDEAGEVYFLSYADGKIYKFKSN